VVLFFGCFVVANVLVLALVHARRPREMGRFLLEAGAVSAVALLLVGPWLVRVAGVSRQEIATDTMFAQSEDYHHLSWAFVTTWSVPAPLLGAAVLGAAWALLRRSGRALTLALWVALLFLLSNPRLLGLPTTLVNNGAVVLALYLPVGMLGGYFCGELLAWVTRRWDACLGELGLAVLVVAGIAIGLASLSRRILQPWRFFVTEDDMRAYTWIRQSVPEDAIFAVQAIQGISPLLMHGIDGGYWIPYMTGRRSTLPPMPYVSELSLTDAEPINRLAAETRGLPRDHEALARLRAQGITHVYVVEPCPGPVQGTWKPEDFAADRAYRLVYHRGTVWIFALGGT
jgi:NADH:ubiquinone oxidoreductase subunit 6 (subunit J)